MLKRLSEKQTLAGYYK